MATKIIENRELIQNKEAKGHSEIVRLMLLILNLDGDVLSHIRQMGHVGLELVRSKYDEILQIQQKQLNREKSQTEPVEIELVEMKGPSIERQKAKEAIEAKEHLSEDQIKDIYQQAAKHGWSDVVSLLLSRYPNTPQHIFESYLLTAAYEGHDEVVRLVVKKYPSISAQVLRAPLINAARKNHIKVVGWMVVCCSAITPEMRNEARLVAKKNNSFNVEELLAVINPSDGVPAMYNVLIATLEQTLIRKSDQEEKPPQNEGLDPVVAGTIIRQSAY